MGVTPTPRLAGVPASTALLQPLPSPSSKLFDFAYPATYLGPLLCRRHTQPPSSSTRQAAPSPPPPTTRDHRRSSGLPDHPSKPIGHKKLPIQPRIPKSLTRILLRSWPRQPSGPPVAGEEVQQVTFFSFVTSLCIFHETRGLSS